MAEAQSSADGVGPVDDSKPSEAEQPTSLVGRIRSINRRAIIFLVTFAFFIVLALTGVFNTSSDVNITRQQAINIALEYAQFEPESADARLVRQGFRLTPVWGVSMSISDPDDQQEFERLNTVEIDAQTGEVLRVSVDDIDAIDESDDG